MIPIYVLGALPGFFSGLSSWSKPNIIAIFSLVVLGPIYGEWLRQLAGDAGLRPTGEMATYLVRRPHWVPWRAVAVSIALANSI